MTGHGAADAIAAVRADGRQRTARCPAHDDTRASLSVGLSGDGRVLLHCQAGCSYDDVREAVGLERADLRGSASSTPTTRYEIRDTDNTLVAVHVRTDRPDGKRITWQRPDGTAGLGGMRTADLPLYGAHKLREWDNRPVVVCEGEKATESLWRRGVPAVGTVTGASGTPSTTTLQVLSGRRVHLWPDADEPGGGHMRRIHEALTKIGITDVSTVTWADAPKGGDAADFTGDVHGLLERGVSAPASATFTLTTIGDLLAEPEETVEWLVRDRIPAGGIVVFAGKPKAGKSTAVRGLALAVARGDDWLSHACHAGTVWYLAFEGRRRDIRSHFRQMGATAADALHVFVGQAPRDVIAHVDRLAADDRPDCIIIDTLQRFLRAESMDDYAEMTTLLDHVIGIAQRSGSTIVLVHHAGKADRASIDSVLGSTAITGSADTIIIVNRTDRYRTVSTIQRHGDDLPETVILLDEASGRVRLGGSKAQADHDRLQAELLEALARAERALTREDWFELVEARRAELTKALRALEAGNKILRSGAGTRNSPYRYTSVSCSLVPSIDREQETNLSLSPTNTEENSCSRVPTQETPVPNDEEDSWLAF